MTAINSIKKVISIIKTELKDIYPMNEIDSFVYLIFEQLFDYSRTKLLISQEFDVQEDFYKQILNIINDLKLYKPIQYILKETSFFNLSFNVNSNVLIPRPETEELVDWIIQENQNKHISILDIGTGSGCIAIALAKNLPNSEVYACDISKEALSQTKINSKLNNVNVNVMHLDILDSSIQINEKFDIIVSNPPYITEKEKILMHKNVLDYEPEQALFVPNDKPLIFYKAIIKFGLGHLKPNGKIYFEINESYGKETALLLEADFQNIRLKKDINEKDRMLKGMLK
ncbi:MAG: peptide chain release factor N(5)-glutamine methyltransferase [Bacteroidales bacterium]|jgi:release factor glutamine methyltransferase|nr:peptide chain release factor N(5)-glutamine methyltransferase [Bacteroidales bacterium]